MIRSAGFGSAWALVWAVWATPSFAASSEIPDHREFPLSPEISPCNDLYQHTCAKVIESFQLRDDRQRHRFAFEDSTERILEKKKKYLSNLSKTNPESKPEKMIKGYYQACMDASAQAREEKEFVAESVAFYSAPKSTRSEIQTRLSQRALVHGGSAYRFGILSNQDEPLWNDFILDVSWMSLPEKSYYEKAELVLDYKKIIALFFRTVGRSSSQADAEARAEKVFNLEKKIASQYLKPEEVRQIMSSKTKISKAKLLSSLPALKLEAMLARVPERTLIRDVYTKALVALNQALSNADLEALKDAALFFEASDYLDEAYPEFFQAVFEFQKKHMGGPLKRADRQERCTKELMAKFDREIDFVLLPRLFPSFPKERVIEIAEKIRKSILTSLDKNTWLSLDAKKEAKAKISKAKLQLVSPSKLEDWDFTPEADYSETAPLGNIKKYAALIADKEYGELKKKSNPDRWEMSPLTVNAYYEPSLNQFVLPQGILQPPFFDAARSDFSNLGSIGSVIGHELGHGIDDVGSKYDSSGRLRSWLKGADLKKLHLIAAPLVDQFNRAGMNGKLTLGENIGDLVGVTAAYEAAFPRGASEALQEVKERKKEFFLGWGRLWCGIERPGFTEMRHKVDPHADVSARVNEQVKHQQGFVESFGCTEKDTLFLPPARRLRIW